jgi:hypothetical protein
MNDTEPVNSSRPNSVKESFQSRVVIVFVGISFFAGALGGIFGAVLFTSLHPAPAGTRGPAGPQGPTGATGPQGSPANISDLKLSCSTATHGTSLAPNSQVVINLQPNSGDPY